MIDGIPTMLSGHGLPASGDAAADPSVGNPATGAPPARRSGHADADAIDFACRLSVAVLPNVLWAGVTIAGGGAVFTAAATDPRVTGVQQAQYDLGDGPCLRAARHDRSITLRVDEIAIRWPDLARVARSAGIGSTLAEPLHAGTTAIGSLNLYGSFPAYDLRIPRATLAALTAYLERLLTGDGAGRTGLNTSHLRRAIGQREVIEQARGVLMRAGGLTRPEAEAALQRQAEQRRSTLIAAARTVLRRHHSDTRPTGTA